jgi:hypothetical protein
MKKLPDRQTAIMNTLAHYRGRCVHEWVGAIGGSFGCPMCGDHEGDHHLEHMEPIPVQPDDWGTAWDDLKALSET